MFPSGFGFVIPSGIRGKDPIFCRRFSHWGQKIRASIKFPNTLCRRRFTVFPEKKTPV
jgi:hypothetical protein